MRFLRLPEREYLLIVAVSAALAADLFAPASAAAAAVLWVAALAGSLPTAWAAARSIVRRRITIDTFNIFALAVSFATREVRSAAFIVLMLTFARLLDWYTESRTKNAVEELLRLKPEHAFRVVGGARGEHGERVEKIGADGIREGDILLVEEGGRVPADGIVVFGEALVNEASVTGESVPVPKGEGDRVLSGTLAESGTIKLRATGVGKDSTLERMAALIREAQKNKSRSERLADRFAAIFFPVVLISGAAVYLLTKNILMTAALFLVACADDMAVAIPLAATASLGRAASRGVIVKGGEWLDAMGKVKTLVLDKTGTLTYGAFTFRDADIIEGVSAERFWTLTGAAEKFSEHPVGRAIFREAAARVTAGGVPSPDEVKVHRGNGIWARIGSEEVAIGDEGMCADLGIVPDPRTLAKLGKKRAQFGGTTVLVAIGGKCAGLITVADVPREEAGDSIRELRAQGVRNVIMFTGDNEATARTVAEKLSMTSYVASMSPEDKMRRLEELLKDGPVAMVGDGINDSPALARADVGIAMGGGGAAVAVAAADLVILTDDLSRVPEMVALGRRTASVIRWDMIIWVLSNAAGFALVLTGIAGPALAAFYNFATDFLPLANSTRLFAGGPHGARPARSTRPATRATAEPSR